MAVNVLGGELVEGVVVFVDMELVDDHHARVEALLSISIHGEDPEGAVVAGQRIWLR
jgi:hypothetical protein